MSSLNFSFGMEAVALILTSLVGIGMFLLGWRGRCEGELHIATFGTALVVGSVRRCFSGVLSDSVNQVWATSELLLFGIAFVLYLRERRRTHTPAQQTLDRRAQ